MPWKDGKKWVYSITYDEGCEDLLKHALPLHRKYGVPGHVALVSSQIGVPRNCPGSSYDGMMILSKAQLRDLFAEGWGMSCHSLTHCGVTLENGPREVVEAKQVLEHALDMAVPMFCVPGDNTGHPGALKYAAEAGFTSIECELLDSFGCQRACIAPYVLRIETALEAAAAIAIECYP